MKFAVYRTDTGEIVRRCDASPSQVQIQAGDGEEVYLNCPADATHVIHGEPATIAPETPPDTREATLLRVRVQRGMLLSSCDWTQLPDSPLAPQQREAWARYRKELRDMTMGDPFNPVWPEPPQG